MRNFAIPALLATAAGLSGCFGGGGDDAAMPAVADDPLTAVPAATASSLGAILDYQLQLAALRDAAESREPIDLNGVTLASSDTAEPIGLD